MSAKEAASSVQPPRTPEPVHDPFADIIAERVEEWESLISTYSSPSPEYVFQVTEPGHGFKFSCGPLQLAVTTALMYPAFAPSYHLTVVNEKAQGESEANLAELESNLRSIAREKRGEVFLKGLVEEIRKFVQNPPEVVAPRSTSIPEPIVKASKSEPESPAVVQPPDEYKDVKYWLGQQLISGIEHLDTKAAQSFMGKITIQSITQSLPPSIRLLHAEVILRAPLVRRFNEAREALVDKYAAEARKKLRGDNRRWGDAYADRFTQINIVYHGTQRQHVGSIVRSGFVPPGTKTTDGVKVNLNHGSPFSLGDGIYASAEVIHSIGYSDTTKKAPRLLPGQKVLVCAALLGKQYQIKEDEPYSLCSCCGLPEAAFSCESAVTLDKTEYVIFNPAHLLPLYVLHLEDSSAANDGSWENEASSDKNVSDKDRRKLLTAQARKHFPYGFGAAGSQFVVEEIASPQDDEEEWGEHQMDRLDLELSKVDAVGEFQRMRL